ncbi:hypothetical protein F0562_030542 [Nyssa sinensis]|uniref:Uncharacterized protein n=1 Tax=Nyssa sinensis TaxID=561372 RepID=A0A5J5AZ29_9ASTE|nr:hypothetical protein F0562_030542 [Nyssa sinensis]
MEGVATEYMDFKLGRGYDQGSGWIRFGYREIDRGSGSGSSGATGCILFGFLRFYRFQSLFPIENRWMIAAMWCIDDGCNGDESWNGVWQ